MRSSVICATLRYRQDELHSLSEMTNDALLIWFYGSRICDLAQENGGSEEEAWTPWLETTDVIGEWIEKPGKGSGPLETRAVDAKTKLRTIREKLESTSPTK